MRARSGRRRALLRARDSDAKNATIAASLQVTCPKWLVMWSRWRQEYTGFACFTREPTIVDAAKIDVFLAHIARVELSCSSGQIHG